MRGRVMRVFISGLAVRARRRQHGSGMNIRLARFPAPLPVQLGSRDNDADLCRTLMREYTAFLNASAGGEHICVATMDQELASLPGPYAEPAGAILLAFDRRSDGADEPA